MRPISICVRATVPTERDNPMFYAFTAYNSETLYGWTTNEAVLKAMLDRLNRKREINLYSAEALGDTDETRDLSGQLMVFRDDLIIDDDTTVDGVNWDADGSE